MYKIGWEATYGYGDILGAYCYASRMQSKMKSPINLEFWWYADREWMPNNKRYHEKDAETVFERVEKIKEHVEFDDTIKITHKDLPHYKDDPRHRTRFFNKNDHSWKSSVWKTKKQPQDDGHIAVWTSKTNKDDLRKHKLKHWKIPYTYQEIEDYIRKIEFITEKKSIHVDYRMPVDEVFDIIRTSSFCIGNDGIGNVISKNYFKPIITTSKNTDLTKRTSGPWAYIINPKEYTDNEEYDMKIIEDQYEKIDEYRSRCY